MGLDRPTEAACRRASCARRNDLRPAEHQGIARAHAARGPAAAAGGERPQQAGACLRRRAAAPPGWSPRPQQAGARSRRRGRSAGVEPTQLQLNQSEARYLRILAICGGAQPRRKTGGQIMCTRSRAQAARPRGRLRPAGGSEPCRVACAGGAARHAPYGAARERAIAPRRAARRAARRGRPPARQGCACWRRPRCRGRRRSARSSRPVWQRWRGQREEKGGQVGAAASGRRRASAACRRPRAPSGPASARRRVQPSNEGEVGEGMAATPDTKQTHKYTHAHTTRRAPGHASTRPPPGPRRRRTGGGWSAGPPA
jgi:hypothetical protein